jgi:exodeoxyribonuclease VII large subunit
MENTPNIRLGVSDFIALTNQTLEFAYPSVEVEGEVASFKVNQGKFVFFDLKDQAGSVGCFMTLWQLRTPIEDGMKVVVVATPKLTPWGKFSLTVRAVRPSGEGNLKKSFELLKAKLDKEGLFSPARKRALPALVQHVAVISSTQAAGYADFIKILNDRWGGLEVEVAHVQVQGATAPDQIIRALQYFNMREELPQVVVIVRGGGSADDLSAFNDEQLVREIAASRIPTLVGVGHEIDMSLADMVADVRAATPSNAAQILTPDRNEIVRTVRRRVEALLPFGGRVGTCPASTADRRAAPDTCRA